jgi:hypothetical protein
MQPYNHTPKRLKIPLYDIGTIVAGFYIGYNEGKGMDPSQTIKYLMKYGPTILTVCMTPIFIKASYVFGRWINRRVTQSLQDGNLEITQKNATIKKYKNLTEDEKIEVQSKIINTINNLESKLQNSVYLKPTLKAGTRTVIETFLGYTAGRAYGVHLS